MPNPVLRLSVVVSTLIAALLMAGLGSGVAAADPEDPGDSAGSDPGTATPAAPNEPEPTTGLPTGTPPSIFDIPQTIATQLRDMFGRPLSIVGNGRVPGTLTVPGVTTGGGATTGRKRDRPSATRDEPTPDPAPANPVAPPTRRSGSTVDVALPVTTPISVPVPAIPVPGYGNPRWTLDLTDPYAAYTSVRHTLETVNSLLSDAYAPRDPFRRPAPAPAPAFRTFEEEPSVVDAEGVSGVPAPSTGSSGLAVLQLPVLVPQVRAAPPRPVTGTRPPAVRDAAAAPPPGARTPELQGPAARPAAGPADRPPPAGVASAAANTVPRAGATRNVGAARTSPVATVALPGLAGLIALTASGGVIGYRQANFGRYLRSDAARFLP